MKKDDCIFCKIAAGEIPSSTVYEDENFRAILDLSPASKGHTLILPKQHADNIMDLDSTSAAKVLPVASKIGKAMLTGLNCDGFNVIQNNGEAAGQTVMHFHVHVIPRYQNDGCIAAWTPGKDDDMENTAKKIIEGLK
jgi:histidine triad (HIT) family protein